MHVRSITELKNISGKRVLLRIDANVPLKKGKIVDDYKLLKSLPTIIYLLRQKAKIVIVSHLGRPNGYDKKLSLRPIHEYFEKKLQRSILFFDQSRLNDPWKRGILLSEQVRAGDLMMLENIRFDTHEEKNISVLSRQLSRLADLFVLDGFGVAHRTGASVTGVAKFLPAYAGLLLEEEVKALSKSLEKPRRPVVLVLGGAKMETKIPLIKNFLSKADYILLSGGIIATYLWYQGKKVGSSLIEKELPRSVFNLFKNKKIILPRDVTVGTVLGKEVTILPLGHHFEIAQTNQGIYDIGPETLAHYRTVLDQAQVIVWNGGLGYFEQKPYNKGTETLARMIVRETKRGAFSICGGGETEQLLRGLKLEKNISLVSTGGGAMLEFLSGKKLPGIEVVRKR